MAKKISYLYDCEALFSGGHTYMKSEENFDYVKEGFGPVLKSTDEVVTKMIEYIENGAKIETKYQQRIEAFFTYRDGQSAQRIRLKI